MEIFAVEVLTGKIKIEYADGSREEIEGGIYERKNTSGDTVEQRTALPADIERLSTLAAAFEADLGPITAPVTQVETIGGNIEIKYADGTKEEIENGIYERKDSNNETIVERAAEQSDVDRLTALADEFTNPGSNDDTPSNDDSGADGETEDGSDDDDRIGTGDGDDSVEGHGGDDRIRTHGGDDTVNGGAGEDRMRGGGGNDEMNGGAGDDRMRGGGGNDDMNGGGGDDRMRGDAGQDTMSGGAGDDRVRGGAGDDEIHGDNGDDRVIGNRGDDTLDGGDGADIYKGGAGADTFVFQADGEEDIIKGFESGVDVIDLTSYGFTSVSQILNAATERGGDTYIDLGGGDVIKLDDVPLSAISADDFIF